MIRVYLTKLARTLTTFSFGSDSLFVSLSFNMFFTIIIVIVLFLIGVRIYNTLTCGICKSSVHLVGKVVIVTGANAGIGYETAKDFAARGARVILGCRNETLAVSALERITETTGNEDVHFKKLDLASLKSVREFAKGILETEKRLDILVNNAGVFKLGKKYTEDGLLIGMQTNHFGPFLLTHLLLPLLKSSAPSRIVNVSSYLHKWANIDIDDLNFNKVPAEKFSDTQVYCTSKLCNVLMTVELSRRLKGTGVTTNSLHPGVVETEIDRNHNYMGRLFHRIMWKFMKDSWEGAQTTIYLAVSPEVKDVTGKYFSDCKEANTSSLAKDDDLARKLWQKSEIDVKI